MPIFFDEYGVNPLGYIGLAEDLGITAPVALEVQSAVHNNYSTLVIGKAPLFIFNSKHSLLSDLINVRINILVHSSIHKLYTHKDLNAPVIFSCDSYLDTPFKNRVLETEAISRILDTPEESRILETPYEC